MMKTKVTKLITLGAMVIIITSMLTGCGNKTENTSADNGSGGKNNKFSSEFYDNNKVENLTFKEWKKRTEQGKKEAENWIANAKRNGDIAEAIFIYRMLIEEGEELDQSSLSASENTEFDKITSELKTLKTTYDKKYWDNLSPEQQKEWEEMESQTLPPIDFDLD